jgi:hypothetical protein
VSEYQYYDFHAIGRPLTKKEMAALRSISMPATITSTSFTNHYEWGDLKANPSKLLEKYFDAFVYVANWGTHEFYIRLPQESVDYKLLKAMVPGETVRVRKTARFVIVEFGCESEWDGEDDGTGWMASLMPLRSDLLRGDLRCLYLGWLRSAQDGGLDEDEMEPRVPADLQQLSGSLDALIEFLEINEDLVEVAARASKPLAAGPSRKEVSARIRRLSEKDRTSCSLLRSWSKASGGETTSCGVSGVRTYSNPLKCPLQSNGVRWAIFWQRPMLVRRTEPGY